MMVLKQHKNKTEGQCGEIRLSATMLHASWGLTNQV
jgi:hypothetical protein